MFNVFLLPKLELALRYVHGQGTAAGSPAATACWWAPSSTSLSPAHAQPLGCCVGAALPLPSWLEAAAKVSELFLRVNSCDPRWGLLGRLILRTCQANTRMDRARRLAGKLQWSLQLQEEHRPSARLQHLFDAPAAGVMPLWASVAALKSPSCLPVHVKWRHDAWQGWGADTLPPHTVHVFTDGSYVASPSPASSSSAWAVTVRDQWLDDHHRSLPSDEQLMQPHDVAGAAAFGASIACTQGIYPAELQAIARALAMLPLAHTLHIHSDSQGALAGIRSYEQQTDERQRLRMGSHPLLQLIHHLHAKRSAAGGQVHYHHVKAHTSDTDIASVGNRVTDYTANRVRPGSDCSRPLSLLGLPLAKCENYMSISDEQQRGLLLIDDTRRSALVRMQSTAFARWQQKSDQGELACPGMLDLGRVVLQRGTREQQATFVHVATNSIHYFRQPTMPAGSELHQLPCSDACHCYLTIAHLAACEAPASVAFRARLKLQLLPPLGRVHRDSQPAASLAGTRDARAAARSLAHLPFGLGRGAASSSASRALRRFHHAPVQCRSQVAGL